MQNTGPSETAFKTQDVGNFLLDWFSGSSDASLPLNTFDKIENNNLTYHKVSLYRFYRFPIQLTNFYRFYELLSIIGFIDWTSRV